MQDDKQYNKTIEDSEAISYLLLGLWLFAAGAVRKKSKEAGGKKKYLCAHSCVAPHIKNSDLIQVIALVEAQLKDSSQVKPSRANMR